MARLWGLIAAMFFCIAVPAQTQDKVVLDKEYFYKLYDEYCGGRDGGEIVGFVRQCFDGLDVAEKEKITGDILADVAASSDVDDDSFLESARRALFILPQEQRQFRFALLNAVAEVYLLKNNREMLQATVNQMRSLVSDRDAESMETLHDLQMSADSIRPLSATLNGWWISNICSEEDGRPLLVLNVMDFGQSKQVRIAEVSSLSSGTLDVENSLLRVSDCVEYDVPQSGFSFTFHNRSIQKGNAAVSKALLGQAQSTNAQFRAVAQDRRATLGQTVVSTIAGAAIAAGLTAVAQEAATSRASDETISIKGYKVDESTLNARLSYQYMDVDSRTMIPLKSDLEDAKFHLYKWNPDDDIVFAMPDCSPFSPYIQTLLPEMELYKVKKQTSFWRGKYLGIGVGATIAGLACAIYGADMLSGVEGVGDNTR